MERNDIKRLPVMRENTLVGIVRRSDLLRAVASLARDVPDPTADDDTSAAA
jgi:CBS domain-containing protein